MVFVMKRGDAEGMAGYVPHLPWLGERWWHKDQDWGKGLGWGWVTAGIGRGFPFFLIQMPNISHDLRARTGRQAGRQHSTAHVRRLCFGSILFFFLGIVDFDLTRDFYPFSGWPRFGLLLAFACLIFLSRL
jgi:hypothetical protein